MSKRHANSISHIRPCIIFTIYNRFIGNGTQCIILISFCWYWSCSHSLYSVLYTGYRIFCYTYYIFRFRGMYTIK